MSFPKGAYSLACFPKLSMATRRQWTNNHNGQVYSLVKSRQQTNQLLDAESLESSSLDVRHPGFMHPNDARRNTLVHPSNSGEDRLPELFLQSWNWVIDHS